MARPVRRIGRYELFAPIASGGMATVHLGRLVGTAGFSRTVAVKRLHDHYARDRSFVEALLEEARLTARISHSHVAQTLDVVSVEDDGTPVDGRRGSAEGGTRDVFLVMEYVHGVSLAMLMKLCPGGLPPPIACSIVSQSLHGLHAAHEAMSATREPLGIVHQDVSPQNIMVGADGSARVIDFGIAKATRNAPSSDDQVRGKVRYMAPEQMQAGAVDRRTDVFAAGIVLYELLTGKRYYADVSEAAILNDPVVRLPKTPSAASDVVSGVLDLIVTRALATSPRDRFATAEEMALAIEEAEGIAPAARVGEWLRELAADVLAERGELVAEVEAAATGEFPVAPREAKEREAKEREAKEREKERDSSESFRGAVMALRERPSSSRMTASLVSGSAEAAVAPSSKPATPSTPPKPRENTATFTATVSTPPLFADATADLVPAAPAPAPPPPPPVKVSPALSEATGFSELATLKKKAYERIDEPTVTGVAAVPGVVAVIGGAAVPSSERRRNIPTLDPAALEEEPRPLAETMLAPVLEAAPALPERPYSQPSVPSVSPISSSSISSSGVPIRPLVPGGFRLRTHGLAAVAGSAVVLFVVSLVWRSVGGTAVRPNRVEMPDVAEPPVAAVATPIPVAAEIPTAPPSIVVTQAEHPPLTPPRPRGPKGAKHVPVAPSGRPAPAPAPAPTEDPFKTWR